MAADMVVALGQAAARGQTLFGQSCHHPEGIPALGLARGRDFALGEKTATQWLELPQARKTYTVCGFQPPGRWGYEHGLNECHLAMGCSSFTTKLRAQQTGLSGPDLVRLALERCHSARQAVDLVTDLVERHGQGAFPGCPDDAALDCGLLIADPREAFALEASGGFWVHQEVRQVRAVGDVCLIRQDWDRIAPGLAGLAIENGWWAGDGSKVDFAGAVLPKGPAFAPDTALRRWARATLLLEQQNGHIDAGYLRRILRDHYDGTPDEIDPLEETADPVPLCRHAGTAGGAVTVASFIAELPERSARLPLLWCAFGRPCTSVYLPIFLDGDYPAPLFQGGTAAHSVGTARRLQQMMAQAGLSRECVAVLQHNLDRLQLDLDTETESFAAEAADLKERGNAPELVRRVALFGEHVREQTEKVADELEGIIRRLATRLETASLR